MAEKLNCWEFKKCGREPGGEKVKEHGVCPAAADDALDGANRGKKGGRICWMVSGTFHEDEKQGDYTQKLKTCLKCSFLNEVSDQEGRDFVLIKKPAPEREEEAGGAAS